MGRDNGAVIVESLGGSCGLTPSSSDPFSRAGEEIMVPHNLPSQAQEGFTICAPMERGDARCREGFPSRIPPQRDPRSILGIARVGDRSSLISQVGGQPSLDFPQRPTFASRVVLYLILR